MRGKARRKIPEIVLREGKPSAVIPDIDDYREMLERLEDIEDLSMLQEMRKGPLKFRELDDFLSCARELRSKTSSHSITDDEFNRAKASGRL